MIHSGNDAAYALAQQSTTITKDDNTLHNPVDTFVSLMNNKAIQIGLTDTTYKDPAGLDGQDVNRT